MNWTSSAQRTDSNDAECTIARPCCMGQGLPSAGFIILIGRLTAAYELVGVEPVYLQEDGAHSVTLNDDNTTTSGETPSKPARRRVTRAVSSPATKPVQFLTAETPAVAAPKTTSGNASVVSSAAASSEGSNAVAPRRSRRVTSSGKASTSSVAVSGTANEIAVQAHSANEQSALKRENDSTTAEGTTDQQRSQGKKSSAKKTNSKNAQSKGSQAPKKSIKKAVVESQDVDTSASATEASQPTLDGFEDAPAAQKKTRKRTTRPAQDSTPDTALDKASDTAPQNSASAPNDTDKPADGEKPAARNRSRSRARAVSQDSPRGDKAAQGATNESSSESAQAADRAGSERVSAERAPAEPKRGRNRRANVFSDAQGEATPKPAPVTEPVAPSRPRLATTALLFQAPDLSAVPSRSVGAQIDSTTAADEEVEETEVVETAEAETETEATPNRNRRDRGRNRNRNRREATETEETPADAEAQEPEVEAEPAEIEEDEDDSASPRRRRRRGGRGRRNRSSSADSSEDAEDLSVDDDSQASDSGDSNDSSEDNDSEEYSSSRRRRRRRRRGSDGDSGSSRSASDEVTALKGSTRLEAKRQRRREGRDAGRRRTIITEAEFLARREAVERSMVVRERNGRTQIAVLEDGVLVEHYVSQQSQASMAGNVYLGRVQNVLPSMEAAFVDIGKGRNAVLYAGEVNWDVHGVNGQPRRIEDALKSGDSVLVQVTKDPIGHKGARLTSQITLAGRYLVYVPGGGMTGISRKLPDTERTRLKRILKEVVPDGAGVIVRTAAEGASEEELTADIARLRTQWENIEKKSKSANAPALLQGEPDLAIRVVRDIFNDDFTSLKVQGSSAWDEISQYVNELAPDLAERVTKWVDPKDIFAQARIDEQLTKGMDRKVWLPSGGSLVIDRTEAMTVIDVNTGKFTGAGGTLEETVTRNNIEAAEEIVRQLRLRDIGGIIVIDFIDMVLESNRDLVLRRLVECLGRDRTKHQVAEVTSLGLVQMTRKRVGQGLVEAFSTNCEHCNGRGFIVHEEPNEKQGLHPQNSSPVIGSDESPAPSKRSRRKRANKETQEQSAPADAAATVEVQDGDRDAVKAKLATIAAAAAHAHDAQESELKETTEADATQASDAAAFDSVQVSEQDSNVAPSQVASDSSEAGRATAQAEPAQTEPAQTEPTQTEPAPRSEASAQVEGSQEPGDSSESATDVVTETVTGQPKQAKQPVLDVLAEFGLKEN